jgi:UDP-N-acetylmuramoyl-L-alanyl-D-glutamate--2,6-diaminopimelate ligase
MNQATYRTGMIGITNIYNFSMAAAILTELGYSPEKFAGMFADIRVSGRMESVPNGLGFSVVVDYAHKPDALDKLLRTVRGVVKDGGRVLSVFGCGGDRDHGKRPIMGKIAGDLADLVFLTSDNPRTEDPMAIIREVEAGLKESKNPNYIVESDRRKAIRAALKAAVKGDLVVIAGKGHEDYQIVGKARSHFSDREEVLTALTEMKP